MLSPEHNTASNSLTFFIAWQSSIDAQIPNVYSFSIEQGSSKALWPVWNSLTSYLINCDALFVLTSFYVGQIKLFINLSWNGFPVWSEKNEQAMLEWGKYSQRGYISTIAMDKSEFGGSQ